MMGKPELEVQRESVPINALVLTCLHLPIIPLLHQQDLVLIYSEVGFWKVIADCQVHLALFVIVVAL
jgi:hypothetical protein